MRVPGRVICGCAFPGSIKRRFDVNLPVYAIWHVMHDMLFLMPGGTGREARIRQLFNYGEEVYLCLPSHNNLRKTVK
jgi:hypothetical protein